MTPRPVGRPTAKPAVDGSTRASSRSRTAITAASGRLPRVAGRHASGPGTSGGAGARCTGSARSSVPNVPVIRTRSCGLPSSPRCTTRISAVDTVRPPRSASTRTSTGPAARRGQEVRSPGEQVGVAHRGEPGRRRRRPERHQHATVDRVPDQPPLSEVARGDPHGAGLRRPRRRPSPRSVPAPGRAPTGRASSRRRRVMPGRAYGDPMTGSIHWPTAVLVAAAMLLLWLAGWLLRRNRRRGFLSEVDRATYATLHKASLASQHLGDGLTSDAAEKAGRHLLSILGAHAVSIADPGSVLSWTGLGDHHRGTALALGEQTRETGRTVVHSDQDVACSDPDCPIRSAVTAPLVMDDLVVGTLTAWTTDRSPAWPAPPRRWPPGSPASWPWPRWHPHPGHGRRARPARADQPALHLQQPRRDRVVRSHRPRPGPRAAHRLRRLHPVRPARRGAVHHARRGAARRRALPRTRAGPVRRPASRSRCSSPPRCCR